MPEVYTCYTPGDRFVTMADDGTARVWSVKVNGEVHVVAGELTSGERPEPRLPDPAMRTEPRRGR